MKFDTVNKNHHRLSIYIATGVTRASETEPWVLKVMPKSTSMAILNTPKPEEHAWFEGYGFFYTGPDGSGVRIPDDKIVVTPIHRNGASTFEIFILQELTGSIMKDNGLDEVYLIVNSEKELPDERLMEYAENHCMKPFDFFASGVAHPTM